jgi:hypothetical protein
MPSPPTRPDKAHLIRFWRSCLHNPHLTRRTAYGVFIKGDSANGRDDPKKGHDLTHGLGLEYGGKLPSQEGWTGHHKSVGKQGREANKWVSGPGL